MITLEQAAEKIVNKCMGVKKEDKVLVITDKNRLRIGRAIEAAALKLTATKLIEIPVGKHPGEEPSKDVAEIMKLFDVIIIPTTMSLSHTKARRDATKAGARISTLPGITEEILERTMEADYDKIKERTDRLAEALTNGSKIEITTEKGTDIKLSIEGRKGLSDTGLMHEKGRFSNLPAGEACLAPVEGTANGVVIIDTAGDKDTKITIKDGHAVLIEGGAQAEKLEKDLKKVGQKAYNVAEIGIGTNDKAAIIGIILEDEKVLGTAHIAFGNNISYGGKVDVPIHIDCIFYRPTIFIDGKKILDVGDIII